MKKRLFERFFFYFFSKNKKLYCFRTHLLLFFILLVSNNICAQNDTRKYSAESIIPQTPNVASFARYGQYPVDLSSGLVGINIPIYTIKTRQLELPITLSYHPSGIKVNDISSNVGLGWSLNAGGMISIQVRGAFEPYNDASLTIPDEKELESAIDDLNFSNRMEDLCYTADTQSDKYSYNVSGGVNGSFMYNNKRTLVQVPETDNRIEYNDGIYIITSPDGIKYFFDRNLSSKVRSAGSNGSVDNISGCYLSKILSADSQDSIIFHYEKLPDYYDFLPDFLGYKRTDNSVGVGSSSYYRLKTYSSYTYLDLTLSKIVFSGGEVVFTTKNDRKDKGVSRLTNIQVNQTLIESSTISKCIFSCDLLNEDYFKSDGTISDSKYSKYFYRLKLSGINIKALNNSEAPQSYKFDYNQTKLPYYDYLGENYSSFGKWNPMDNYAQDLWGYYNGKLNNGHLIPYDANYDKQEFIDITGCWNIPDRSVSEECAKACLLEGISYPTGGYTLFEHESNRSSNGSLSGGLRIKRIRSYSSNHESLEEKEYEYSGEEDVSTNGYMAQVSHYKRRYVTSYSPGSKLEILNDFVYTSSPSLFQVEYTNPVFYTVVTEYLGSKNLNSGKKVYKFGFQDNLINGNPGYGSEYQRYTMYGLDRSWMRGDLLEEHTFKNINGVFEEVQSKINRYSLFNIQPHITGLIITNDIFDTYIGGARQEPLAKPRYHWFNSRIYTGAKKLNSSIITDYNNGIASQSKTINYVYDKIKMVSADRRHQQLTKEISLTSSGDEQWIYYMYPLDYEYQTQSCADYNSNQKLRNANIKNLPIEVLKSLKHKGQNDLATEGTFYRYQDINRLSEIYRLETKLPIVYTGSSIIDNNGYNVSDKYQLEKSFSFDTKNNIEQFIDRNNVPTSFIWSYNSLYPIAEIKNATFNEVDSSLDKLNMNSVSLLKDPNPDITKIDQLRIGLPNALISTYTYYPLRGCLTSTDPRGIKKSYHYDDFGRLDNIKDDNSKNIEQYTYNFNPSSLNLVLHTEGQYMQFRSATFNLEVQDGSGYYRYQWMLKDSVGNVLHTDENKQFSILLTQKGILTLTCSVEDINRGTTEEVSRSLNVIPPPDMVVSEITANSAEFRVNGKTVSFTLNPSEGSFNYTYNWALVTATKTITGTSKSFPVVFGENGNMKLTCVVHDIDLNQSISKEYSFVVDAPLPVEFSIDPSGSFELGSTTSFQTIIKDGTGSGNFSYNWVLKSPTKTITGTEKKFNVTFSESGIHIISATVKDLYNGSLKTVKDSIIVKGPIATKYPIAFSNINQTVNSSGEYNLTAKIKCEKSTTLTLEIGVDRPLLSSNNNIPFIIGGKSDSLLSGTKNIEITLPIGENGVSIKYYKTVGSTSKETTWIRIVKVPSDCVIGDPNQVKITAL